MTCFVLCFGAAMGLAVVWVNTRSSRFKQLARQLNMLYHAQLPDVLTEDEKEKSFFLNQGVHQFKNVLTWQDAGAFMRLSEDAVFSSAQSTRAEFTYTLVTAELSKGFFTPLVLTPRPAHYEEENHPALPADLAGKYVLSAPADYRLPQEVLGFLHAGPSCYVELTPHALVYHEFCLCPLAHIQPLRLRVRQLILSLVHQPTPTRQPGPQAATAACAVPPTGKMPAAMSEDELQAQILLKLQGASRSYGSSASGSNAGRWIFAVLFLCVVTGILVFARYALTHWVGR